MKIKDYYTADEISRIANVSKRTIERKRKNILNENPKCSWFLMSKKPYKYKFEFFKEFISLDLFELIQRNHQQRTYIKKLKNPNGTLENHLGILDWDYFCTISYKESLNKEKCFSAMTKFYDSLVENYPNKSFRMYFTTESFGNRKGYHNHFILRAGLENRDVQLFMKRNLPQGKTDVQDFKADIAGIHYVSKNGLQGADWDIMGTDLVKDGNLIQSLSKKVNATT